MPLINHHNRQRRFSCPSGDLPGYHGQLLDTVNEGKILLPAPRSKYKGRKGKRASFSGSSDSSDLSEFALPGLEEEEVDGENFRERSGSAGLKSLLKFRSKHKSGDKNTPQGTPPEDRKGIKGFLDNFRPRSKSDAASIKAAAMMRKKHASGSAAVAPSQQDSVQQLLTDQQATLLGSGDLEPMARQRSTSLGAKDRLRMMKELRATGGNATTEKTTLMGKLISNGIHNGQSSSNTSDKSNGSMDSQEHHYTGRALIWEDNEQTQAADGSFMDRMQIEDIEENDPQVFNKFMRAHKCYDIIPNSSKLIVFDTALSVKKAFYALVYNCVRSAPLWDQQKQKFVGMLTITDFIFILHKYYKSPQQKMKELEEHKISSWRKELSSHYKPFVSISPEESVCQAVRKLHQHKVHRLPVVDPVSGNAVFIVTHKRILKFLHLFMKNLPKPAYMNASIESLHLGTYSNVVSVHMKTKLIEALNFFVTTRVSALPVVDESNKVLDIYAKFDVINLAAEKSYHDLDVSIESALQHRQTKTEHVLQCLRTDSLGSVIEKIVKSGVHRLVITNLNHQLEGIISLSDILVFLLQEDPKLKAVASSASTSCLTATTANLASPAHVVKTKSAIETQTAMKATG